jgi:hypothetical protein
MTNAKKPSKDTLNGPSTGRTIEVDPSWLEGDPRRGPPTLPSAKKTIEVDPGWLHDGETPDEAVQPSSRRGPPPVPAALLRKKPAGAPIPRDEPEDEAKAEGGDEKETEK